MRQIARVLFIAIGGLLLLVALLIFGANLYIQSTFTQERLEEHISRAIHVPVKITRTSISPWHGLTITGITVAQADQAITGDLFQANSLTVRFKFWPIFRHQLIVKEVVLASPTIAWWQDKKGRWQLPKAEPKPTAAPSEAGPPRAQTSPTPGATAAAGERPESSSARVEKPTKKPSKFQVTLQKVRLADGNFYFYDRNGKLLASFENVNATAPEPKMDDAKAEVSIDALTLRGPVVLENVKSPFQYKPDRLALPAFSATLADGQITGDFRADPDSEGTPFRTDLQFRDVDLRQMLARMSQASVDISGRAQGWVQLSGDMARQETLAGSGQLIFHGGQLRSYSLLQILADALHIEELGMMNLKTAQLDFRVWNNRIWVDSLLLQSQNLRLLLWGSAKIGGQLKMQARLSVNSKISHQLPQFVESSFTPIPGTDERSVDFNITGKYDRPKPDLLDRLFGTSLEKRASKAIDLLRGLIGGDRKRNDKTPPPPEPMLTPTPAPPLPLGTPLPEPTAPAASPSAP